jgi:hypothetical protein
MIMAGVAGRPGEAGTTGSRGPNGRITTIYGYNGRSKCNDVKGKSIVLLDRHPLKCDRWSNEFMSRFQLLTAKCTGTDMRYEYLCISPAQWEDCAAQGGKCKCNGVARYGSDPYWTKGKTVTGEIACDDPTWGDPVGGKQKKCQCAPTEKSGVQDCENLQSACQDFGNVVAVRVCVCVLHNIHTCTHIHVHVYIIMLYTCWQCVCIPAYLHKQRRTHVYIYLCVYIYICICVCVVYICIYVCTYIVCAYSTYIVCAYTHQYIWTHAHVDACVHSSGSMLCMYICEHVCVRTYMRVNAHAQVVDNICRMIISPCHQSVWLHNVHKCMHTCVGAIIMQAHTHAHGCVYLHTHMHT